ncbi:unnamed protein product [Leptosia nina]|uniref:Uncharacterized protein n=1 Tax=Leptosia nina TaxID=320188 RepID=A0AAV1JA75_9NEOP
MSTIPNNNLSGRSLLIKKDQKKIIIIHNVNAIREDVLYEATKGDRFFGRYPNLRIVNKLNPKTNANRTIASYDDGEDKIVLSSDSITDFLGQKNYNVLFEAISSVINQTLKIEAILVLLKKSERGIIKETTVTDRHSQTDETYIEKYKRETKKRKRPKACRTYVVDDSNCPPPLKSTTNHKRLLQTSQSERVQNELIDTKYFIEEDGNMSDGSDGNFSMVSCQIPQILENPQEILDNLARHTQLWEGMTLKLVDGSTIKLATKPQDLFHIATSENLRGLVDEDKKKLMLHQAYIDWKYCLTEDNEGNLPIHMAVLENDVDLLQRHCLVLKSHQESLDLPGKGGLSALHLSIICNAPQCTRTLLLLGAPVSERDSECRRLLHIAAETSVECVIAILDHLRRNARKILSEEMELSSEWKHLEEDELAEYLINKFCSAFDGEGHTPLMLASAKGHLAVVSELTKAAPHTVNVKMPTCGNTALLLAVSAAMTQAERLGNKKAIPDEYFNTIQVLVEHGADPDISNGSGTTANMLIFFYSCTKLAQLMASKSLKNSSQPFESYMLVKNEDGHIEVEPVAPTKRPKARSGCANRSGTTETDVHSHRKDKPIIIQNVPVQAKRHVKTSTAEVVDGNTKPIIITADTLQKINKQVSINRQLVSLNLTKNPQIKIVPSRIAQCTTKSGMLVLQPLGTSNQKLPRISLKRSISKEGVVQNFKRVLVKAVKPNTENGTSSAEHAEASTSQPK